MTSDPFSGQYEQLKASPRLSVCVEVCPLQINAPTMTSPDKNQLLHLASQTQLTAQLKELQPDFMQPWTHLSDAWSYGSQQLSNSTY